MAGKEGYDVLRLIEHGQGCYISSEYVRGRPMALQLKYQPYLSREQILEWISSIQRQLEQLHKCRNHPCYQYVNPYSMIISEEGILYLADLGAGSNEDLLRLMRRKSIREHFLPPGEPYYRRASVALDAYGMGKTVQYLLAMSEADPPLGRQDVAKLQKFISHCLRITSKKQIQNLSETRKYIPTCKKQKETNDREWKRPDPGNTGRKALAAAAVLLLLSAAVKEGFFASSEKEVSQAQTREEPAAALADTFAAGRERVRLALAYFLELKDYGKVLEVLEPVRKEDKEAELLSTLAEYLMTPEEPDGEEKENLAGQIRELKEIVETDKTLTKEDRLQFDLCMIRGCQFADTRECDREILRLGEACLESGLLEEEARVQIQKDMAVACEAIGETEKAAELYVGILEQEEDPGQKKDYYEKAAALYEQCGRIDKAVETAVSAAAVLPQEQSFKILHIRLLCQDLSIDRGVCAQTIREYLAADPGLGESSEFQNLKNEYGIRVEGEEVWVGE